MSAHPPSPGCDYIPKTRTERVLNRVLIWHIWHVDHKNLSTYKEWVYEVVRCLLLVTVWKDTCDKLEWSYVSYLKIEIWRKYAWKYSEQIQGKIETSIMRFHTYRDQKKFEFNNDGWKSVAWPAIQNSQDQHFLVFFSNKMTLTIWIASKINN